MKDFQTVRVERGKETKGWNWLIVQKKKKKHPDKDTQVKYRDEESRGTEETQYLFLFVPKRGTWMWQSPYPNISCIYKSWLVFAAHLTLTPFITPVPDSPSSSSFILCLLSTSSLSIRSFLPLSLSLSVLLTQHLALQLKSSVLSPDREPISITKSLRCEGLRGSRLNRSSLPDTDLSSSYSTRHPRKKRTNLEQRDALARRSSRWNSWRRTQACDGSLFHIKHGASGHLLERTQENWKRYVGIWHNSGQKTEVVQF